MAMGSFTGAPGLSATAAGGYYLRWSSGGPLGVSFLASNVFFFFFFGGGLGGV